MAKFAQHQIDVNAYQQAAVASQVSLLYS